jgi:predicted esterase
LVKVEEHMRVVIGPEKQHTATVIFLHGLGDTAKGWADAMHWMAKSMPWVKFVLPTAGHMPITMNMGASMPAWYDIEGLQERSMETCEGIEESSTIVKGLVEAELSDGMAANRIIVAGFSQGGAMSLYTGLQLDMSTPLAGVLCMSGYLPNPHPFTPSAAALKTPVCMCHGALDPMVRLSWATDAKEVLESRAIAVEWNVFDDLQHSAHMEELEVVQTWILAQIPEAVESRE